MDNKQIGNRIKNRRKELNLTLQEVADMVGVASSTIQRYESGFISQHKLPVLESIAKAINVNPTWLVKEDAKMETGIPDDTFIKINKPIIGKSEPLSFTIKISDYLPAKSNELSKEEINLLESYNKLNSLGKEKLIDYSNDLIETPKFTIKEENDVISLEEAKEYLKKFGRAAYGGDNNKDMSDEGIIELAMELKHQFEDKPHKYKK